MPCESFPKLRDGGSALTSAGERDGKVKLSFPMTRIECERSAKLALRRNHIAALKAFDARSEAAIRFARRALLSSVGGRQASN
ncbi:MAG: hypothetical protein WKF30_06380 [Pyrinomonadaceae bacterium]